MNLKLSHEVRGVANREEVGEHPRAACAAAPTAALSEVCLVGHPQAVGGNSHALGLAMDSAHS